MVVTRGENMVWRRILFALGMLLALGMVHATVFLNGTIGKCTVMSPGQTKMFVLSVEEPETAQYIVTITSDGLSVYPKEFHLYLEGNETATRWVKVTAPVMVVDQYYTLDVSVYKADTSELVESKQYCFRVYKGILGSQLPDVTFGYKNVRVEKGIVYVTLYVSNMSRSTISAKLDSDYGRVTFDMNPVIVKPYRTVTVKAEIPVDEYLPEYVKFYAVIDDTTKEITVKMPMPEAIQPKVFIDVPERIVISQPLTELLITVTNEGESPITIVMGGKGLPAGVNVTSDEMTVAPGQTVAVKTYITAPRVLKTGTFLSKICVKDTYGAELACKYTVIEINSRSKTAVETTPSAKGLTVTMTVNNGAKPYYGVSVEITAPKGWKFEANPQTFDLGAYESRSIEVTFVPEKNAVDGTAVIRLIAPDGTVIAQKVVELKKSALTGYATAGSSSTLGLIIAAIVIALIIALIVKKGKEVEETSVEFEELTKKE